MFSHYLTGVIYRNIPSSDVLPDCIPISASIGLKALSVEMLENPLGWAIYYVDEHVRGLRNYTIHIPYHMEMRVRAYRTLKQLTKDGNP